MPALPSNEEYAREWLGRLLRLNAATGRGECRGKAPHKPLLLLCLLDMAENGELPARALTRTAALAMRFRAYGALVVDRWPNRLDLRLPFFHLSTQGFWEPLTAEMRRAHSPDTCVVCEIDPRLFELLADAGFRIKARIVLIAKYFEPTERIAFYESLGLQADAEARTGTPRVMEEVEEAARRKGRNARFAVRVCSEYRYTCALTGYRCVTADGATIVDAAHIEPWAVTGNDDPANGLALSKSAHWMFDEGLWSVDENLRVIVNRQAFTENGPDALRLSPFAGRHLQFDPSTRLRPALFHLRRHRAAHGIV